MIVAEALAAQGRRRGRPHVRRADCADERGEPRADPLPHPLYARDSLGVLADYVTLEQGTGAVHTAPGHGSDDFTTGVRYGLEIYAPVGPGGHFLDTVELFGGQRVFDANPKIEEALKERGRLWHREELPALVSALLALPQPGDLPRDLAVVHRDGRRARRIADAGRRPIGPAAAERRRTLRRPRSTPSTGRASGSPPGAAIGSTACSRTGPTGASRASAPGVCRFRRWTARSAAKRS